MAASNTPALPALTPDDMIPRRKGMTDFEQLAYTKLDPLSPKLEETWVDIPLKDGWLSHTLVVRPKHNTAQKRPLIVDFYGGGYMVGSPIQLALPARIFAEKFNATVLCPSYHLAPEHPWPKCMEDGLELLQIVAADTRYHFGADLSHGFIVGGISAGGGIAAVAAGLLTAEPEKYPIARPLTGVFLSVAGIFHQTIVPPEYRDLWTSREDNRHVEGLNTAVCEQIYLTWNVTDFSSPWFSPINSFTASGSIPKNHPPTYLQAMGYDPLRDDSIVYEKVLAASGIRTKIHLFPDDVHNAFTSMSVGFKSTNPDIREGTLEGMTWLVEQGYKDSQ